MLPSVFNVFGPVLLSLLALVSLMFAVYRVATIFLAMRNPDSYMKIVAISLIFLAKNFSMLKRKKRESPRMISLEELHRIEGWLELEGRTIRNCHTKEQVIFQALWSIVLVIQFRWLGIFYLSTVLLNVSYISALKVKLGVVDTLIQSVQRERSEQLERMKYTVVPIRKTE